jgi:hypothetical protein
LFQYPPWQVFVDDPLNPNNVTYSGLMFEIVNHMADKLNFTYRVTVPRYGTWGLPNKDGIWDGMTGLVANGEVHFPRVHFLVLEFGLRVFRRLLFIYLS